MLLSVTFSKPTSQVESILGKKIERIKIRPVFSNDTSAENYFAEFFTSTQSFHKNFSRGQLDDFLQKNIGASFKVCVQKTEEEEITFLTNKKGRTTRLVKKICCQTSAPCGLPRRLEAPGLRKKNYIIPEGVPAPFLVALGVMTASGKVVSAKYDKFRQINRFLEFVDDIIPDVQNLKVQEKDDAAPQPECTEAQDTARAPLRILDFGSGKSYLTFAVHYYLTQVKGIPCRITGVDLKKQVIENCSALAKKLGLSDIEFLCGDISEYSEKENPDVVITLHACDTATDYALNYAVQKNAKAILSVPCCQHEINLQLEKGWRDTGSLFEPILKYGILRERFSAIITDAIRAEILEAAGYRTQILEFIDMEHTPKNLLIRAVRKTRCGIDGHCAESYNALLGALKVSQKLKTLRDNTL